jgi:hypothetical protein
MSVRMCLYASGVAGVGVVQQKNNSNKKKKKSKSILRKSKRKQDAKERKAVKVAI